MATKARQQYFADENSLQKQRREFSIADDIQQKIDSIEEGAQVNIIETVKVNGTPLIPDANKAVNVEVPEVIDNLYTIDSDNALSAKQGKILYDYIQNIASRGRFLSNWNSATGLPMTNPSESPYSYKSGDYFVVSNVAASGGTNYRPDGSSYIIGQASTVVETEDVSVSDFYFYDGTNWLLLSNSGRQIAIDSSLSTTSTNPVENRVITNALNNKQDVLTAGNHIDITSNVVSTTGLQEELTAGENITIEDICTTESDMKGPCPSGFHVPLWTEWVNTWNIRRALGGASWDGGAFSAAFKLPFPGYRNPWSGQQSNVGSGGMYWSSSASGDKSFNIEIGPSSLNATYKRYRGQALSVRPFKNTPTAPDNTRTKLYGTSIEGGGIFWSSADELISFSSDGTTRYTMADKNLGATTVRNSGDVLSEVNGGYYYQWGNNYGFSRGSITTSSTKVDASNYGPANPYSSNIFISGLIDADWSSVQNDNLRGGVTQGTYQDCATIISATDTTYTAGTGINIDSNNVISSTITPGQTYTAGNGINIDSNNEISIDTSVVATQTDLQNGLDEKQGLLTAGDNITIGDECTAESDMKGPAPSGFHVPSKNEFATLCGIFTNTFSMPANGVFLQTYLKIPFAGYRNLWDADVKSQGTTGCYWSSTPSGSLNANYLYCGSSSLYPQGSTNFGHGNSVRCFKNSPTVPTSSWTTLYDGSSVATGAGVFWDSTNGLISVSGDGTTWYTIMDKNLGATSTDITNINSYGYYYQWGNNYGFANTGTVTTSNTQVDTTNYGPGNYYSDSTFITGNYNWSSVNNGNLWGGVSQSTHQECIHNVISATDTTYTAGTGINIDSNNEISNTLPGAIVSATAPFSPTEGMVWYDTTNDALKAYNGTSWETEGTKMVVLSYGHSTWQDFIDAYNENAIVYCKVSSGSSGYRMAFMAYTAGQGTPTEVEFQYYRSRSSHSTAATALDEVYVYKLVPSNGGTWTVTQRDIAAEPIAGTGIGLTYNASGMTIANTGVTSVNNQTGDVTIQEGIEYNAGEGIEIGTIQDYSAMQGPAPEGYHIPLSSEWGALCGILTTTFSMADNATTMGTYLKMPKAGRRSYSSSDVETNGYYWSSMAYSADDAYYLFFASLSLNPQYKFYRTNGCSIRCFKNTPVVPTSSWTTLYDGSSVATGAGVFYNASLGLISVSGDGTTWYTIMDKNLGATTVYNEGDTLTDANCGYFYQRGNNYGFPHSGNVTTSSIQVDASTYGPGNYYNSSTFITRDNSPYDWSSVQNDNLWGATTGVVTLNNVITNTGVLSVNNQTGDVTVLESQAKIFPMPEVGDNISDLVSWLSAGKVAVLTDSQGLNYSISYWLGEEDEMVCVGYDQSSAKFVVVYIPYTTPGYIVDTIQIGRQGLVPTGGTAGQVLTQRSNGIPNWQNPAGTTYEAGDGIIIGEKHRDSQGPCPSGYHIPSMSELDDLMLVWNTLFQGSSVSNPSMSEYFKMPLAGHREDNWDFPAEWVATAVNTGGTYRSSYAYGGRDACGLSLTATGQTVVKKESPYWSAITSQSGCFIRPLRDTPIAANETWTTLYDGSSVATGAGIFHSPFEGIISISADGTNWITIADKNVGATTVWNLGDTLSESNTGNTFQWGNNYAFPSTLGSLQGLTVSVNRVDASGYGPGNYYSDDTIILPGSETGEDGWDSSENALLWGGENTGIRVSNGSGNTIASKNGVLVFDAPQVGDDISDMINYLNGGGGALIKGSNGLYYTVTEYGGMTLWGRAFHRTINLLPTYNYIEIYHDGGIVSIIEYHQTDLLVNPSGQNGQILTKTSTGSNKWTTPSIIISDQANNILQNGTTLWCGSEGDYANLGTYSSSCIYLTVPGGASPQFTPSSETPIYLPLSHSYINYGYSGNAVSYGTASFEEKDGADCLLLNPGYLEVDTSNSTIFSHRRTLNFWVNCTSITSPQATFVGKGNGNAEATLSLYVDTSSGKLMLNNADETKQYSTLSANTWYNIVVTHNASTDETKVYINSTLISTDTLNLSPKDNVLKIGETRNGQSGSKFYISRFILQSGIRTAQNVTNDYNSAKGYYGIS